MEGFEPWVHEVPSPGPYGGCSDGSSMMMMMMMMMMMTVMMMMMTVMMMLAQFYDEEEREEKTQPSFPQTKCVQRTSAMLDRRPG
jgi:heme/copper-type cytochrome/quinol oxidase subunit 2